MVTVEPPLTTTSEQQLYNGQELRSGYNDLATSDHPYNEQLSSPKSTLAMDSQNGQPHPELACIILHNRENLYSLFKELKKQKAGNRDLPSKTTFL